MKVTDEKQNLVGSERSYFYVVRKLSSMLEIDLRAVGEEVMPLQRKVGAAGLLERMKWTGGEAGDAGK